MQVVYKIKYLKRHPTNNKNQAIPSSSPSSQQKKKQKHFHQGPNKKSAPPPPINQPSNEWDLTKGANDQEKDSAEDTNCARNGDNAQQEWRKKRTGKGAKL